MYESKKFNKRILVSPLDWGLGHATRCIPIIRALVKKDCEVWIATSGIQEILLKEEFPGLNFLHLPGYGVHYGKRGVMLRLIRQLPVIRRHIFTEHAWLQQVVREYGFDGVISDNRYGLYSSKVPSVLITHQLSLQLPRWAFFMKNGIQQLLYHHIENFSECWVPDLEAKEASLAGDMSHPAVAPKIPVQYIGWQSRFNLPPHPPGKEKAVLVSISGPEPQREILEELVLSQIGALKGEFWLVRGKPGNDSLPDVPGNVTMYNHLSSEKLQELMCSCSLLISRSGYSTLMDAMVLRTPIACVPTPGQTEQEYLSKRLASIGWATCQSQEHFNLAGIIEASKKISPDAAINTQNDLLEKVLSTWLRNLK